ncbi:MAG: FeoB small GTPase domain-containing protein, partial [Bdellovibrionota bacterium]
MIKFPIIALAGNPNCGKTALFNALTGGKQKVANYPGVTVERKEGPLKTPDGEILTLIDLPGTYSLDSRTLDEEITRDVIFGTQPDQACPHLLIAVADATNLERNLGLILELKKTGRPMILALNMMDLARDRGLEIDIETLSRGLGMPVIPTVAPQREGVSELIAKASEILKGLDGDPSRVSPGPHGLKEIRDRFTEVDSLLKRAISKPVSRSSWTDRIDRVVLHPLWGSLFLVLMLLVVFQAIFNWATVP